MDRDWKQHGKKRKQVTHYRNIGEFPFFHVILTSMQQNILKAHDKIFLGVLVYILKHTAMSICYKLKFLTWYYY